METQFYLHLSSEDSKTYFPGNDTGTFTVKLPERSWEVALCATDLPKVKKKPQRILVCSDICVESIYGEQRLPLLRVITGRLSTSFQPLQYIPVRIQEAERVTVYVKSGSDEILSFPKGSTSCTLHFRHV